MTTSSQPESRQSLLDAAAQLRKLLQDSLPIELAISAASERYKTATALFSETYKAWEQATLAAAAGDSDTAVSLQSKEAAKSALDEQRDRMKTASHALWLACFKGDEQKILDAAACFEMQNRDFEAKLALDNQACQNFYRARERAGELRYAQRCAHMAHLKAAAEFAIAEKNLHNLQSPSASIRNAFYDLGYKAEALACQFAGGELNRCYLISAPSALELGLSVDDLSRMIEEPVSKTV